MISKINTICSICLYSLKLPFRVSPFLYVFYCIVSFLQMALPSLLLISLKLLIENLDLLGSQKLNYSMLFIPVCFYLIVNFINTEIEYGIQWIHIILEDKLRLHIDLEIMNQYKNIEIEEYENPNQQDVMDTVSNSQWAITGSVLSVVELIKLIGSFVSVIGVLFVYNPIVCLLYLLSNIPYALSESALNKKLDEWNFQSVPERRKKDYYKKILTDPVYAKELRVYNLKEYIMNKYNKTWSIILNKRKKYYKKYFLISNLYGILSYIGYIFIILYAVYFTYKGKIAIAELTTYSSAIILSTELFFTIIEKYSAYLNIYAPRIKYYLTFLKLKSKIVTGNKICKSINEIQIENLTFIYPGTKNAVLHNISLYIKRNQKIAIVGYNGSGKSTLIKLLMRMYEPTEGTIKINQIDVKEYEINSLRQKIGVCFQNIAHFSLSLKENVAFSNFLDIEKESKIYKVLEQVGLDDLVQTWEKKLDQPLTRLHDEHGKELSGGQWQKLSIARAIFRSGSNLLILDEPSSALDPQSEQEIFTQLFEIAADKSMIYISHRLSNMNLFDKIVLLENGKIIEEGKHSELINANGKYALYYKIQSKKFKME